MNHKQHKFLITTIVFVMIIIGVFFAAQFKEVSFGFISIALLLVNSILLLIIVGILLMIKETLHEKSKKRG